MTNEQPPQPSRRHHAPLSRRRPVTVHVAVVHAGATVCHVCAASSPESLWQGLAEYAAANARFQLTAPEASRVLRLWRRGAWREAAERYFESEGHRWSPERLVVEGVSLDAPRGPEPTEPTAAGRRR